MPAPVILLATDIEYRIMKGRANAVITNKANRIKVDEAIKMIDAPFLRYKVLLDGEASGWHTFEQVMNAASPMLKPSDVERQDQARRASVTGTCAKAGEERIGMAENIMYSHEGVEKKRKGLSKCVAWGVSKMKQFLPVLRRTRSSPQRDMPNLSGQFPPFP